MLLVAVKGNREEKIDESLKEVYINNDYKIIEVDESGKQKVLHDPEKADKKSEKKVSDLEKQLAEKEEK